MSGMSTMFDIMRVAGRPRLAAFVVLLSAQIPQAKDAVRILMGLPRHQDCFCPSLCCRLVSPVA